MNFSSLRLPSYSFIVENSSSLSVTQSITAINGTDQIFDWISFNKSSVYPGEAYYRSGSGDYELASATSDEEAEVIGVVEQSISCANNTSLVKLVYYGKLTFDSSSLTLNDGSAYFLATSSANTPYFTGSINIRNTTILEPEIISKPVFVAVSSYEAIMVNYRGMVNSPFSSQSIYVPQSDWDCHCTDTEAIPVITTPAIQVVISVNQPNF